MALMLARSQDDWCVVTTADPALPLVLPAVVGGIVLFYAFGRLGLPGAT